MESNLKVFKSDRFDVEDAASLSLFLYPDSLFIFAKDNNQTNICIHEYINFDWASLEQLVISDHLLKNDVPAKIYLHQPDFCLVPGVLFQPGQEASYLSFASEQKANTSYFNTPLDSNNLQVLSGISSKLKKSLEARFSELTFHHGSVSFLSYLFKERFNLIGQEILISIFGNQIYAAAFSNQELAVFNIFSIDSKEDILKYALILIEQLKFDRNHARVSLFGATEENGITEDWGKGYFHHFRLLTPHANQNFTHGFKHLKSVNLFETNWQFD
ncbi:DUF3822 family protein [Algoriphagus sp. D3-2-R+10]|uniref:DUF3822 family protein n=1 Tax=Algoriphagus aurantiacus TaxID=3103948 RepID=UPI002B374F90|nr:DUF3822 family protein [Algoriphagus sp. D3-2-R+10]MEB2777575.1 DUF3822 family protein [Algoriphagus sp. D3-2-R+10]